MKHPKHELANKAVVGTVSKHIFAYLWFMIGFLFAAMFLFGAMAGYFRIKYSNRVIPGVYIDNIYVGQKSESEIRKIFDNKNQKIGKSKYVFQYADKISTTSASELGIGYDTNMIATQALSIGKTPNLISNFAMAINSYSNGVYLRSSSVYNPEKINNALKEISQSAYIEPINALFTIENSRVVAFRQSQNGQTVDTIKIQDQIANTISNLLMADKTETIIINVPVKSVEPETSTEQANNLGIVESIGNGKSYFVGSIPNRLYNIQLAATRVNGVLIPPEGEFSFNKAIGDVSKFTGYREAYVIQNGKTVLGDGGGVCQVSTTLFRAVLNAGLPISERNAHAYRVSYYEQQSLPGFDATIFVPSVDFKFKNDTKNYILVQSYFDPNESSLTFSLYGKRDNRVVTITNPIVTNQIPAPEPLFQDDPTLPKGVIKQIDFAAAGSNVVFFRKIEKDGKVVADEKYTSVYRPWRAVYLRGTKEG